MEVAADVEPMVKGVGLRSTLASIQRLLGDAVLKQTIAQLPSELAKAIQADTIYTGVWYPLANIRQLYSAVLRVTRRGPELARALGYDATRDDFRGIYRVLVAVVSPEFLIKRTPVFFKRYYTVGAAKVLRAKNGAADAIFSGCVGFDRNLWEGILGGSTAVLEACDAKDVQLLITDGGRDGDENMTVRATWK
jgi:hypothetical protein